MIKTALPMLLSLTVTICMAVPPEEALSTFELHPDFKIELVANEPAIIDPVDMEFDAQGRMFVMEMPGYPFPGRSGNIVLLEDKDDDRVYESRKVFATGFDVATSLLAYEGGFLVASPPDILFLKDTDGDDVADVREVVLTGFTVDNQQHNINGLTLGLDNWIYIANGGNSGIVHFADTPDEKVAMRFDDLRFKWSSREDQPRALEKFGRSSGGFGITHDNYGRWFSTHNTQHISQLVFPGKYLQDIPMPRGGSLAQISDHEENGLARIYPIGAQDTRVNHPEQSGYFSGGCGITHYNGGAFGFRGFGQHGFNDAVFVCDVVLNLVHVDILHAYGNNTALTAGRDGDRPKKAFLASTDRGFRPVNMTVGPDGSLYLMDMYRDVIEHPEWIPDEMEEKLDLDAGKEAGRIYRIRLNKHLLPILEGAADNEHNRAYNERLKATPVPNPKINVNMDEATNEYLVKWLEHENGWYRKTAQRLLIERNATDMRKQLETLVKLPADAGPATQVHALWTLDALGILSDVVLSDLFFSNNSVITENAFWIAADRVSDSLLIQNTLLMAGPRTISSANQVARPGARIIGDEDNRRNRMIMALISSGFDDKEDGVYDLLLWIAERDIADSWSRLAIASAVGRNPSYFVTELLNRDSLARADGSDAMLALLYELVGESPHISILCGMLNIACTRMDDHEKLQLASLGGLIDGLDRSTVDIAEVRDNKYFKDSVKRLFGQGNLRLQRTGWQLANRFGMPTTAQQKRQLIESATQVTDTTLPVETRLVHLTMTEFDAPEKRVPLLFAMLEPTQPMDLQKEAITQLRTIKGQNVAEMLVERWDTLGPAVRGDAGNILLYKRDNHDLLLTALENGDLSLGEMNFHLERRRTLLFSRAPGVKERAEKLFTDAGVVTRKEAMARMRPALELLGDPLKGRDLFSEVCAKCHTVGDLGVDLAPNLTEIFRKSSETLLHDIVDPNAATDIQYIAYNLETRDGDFYSGIVVRDDADGVTLRDADGEHSVSREDIQSFFSSGLSLMPEELETEMEPQSMADLLAFLQEPK